MLIVHEHPGRPRDLVVHVRDPDATVADLCRALTPDRPVTALVVDDRITPPATPLDRAGVGDGSVVRRRDDPAPAPTEAAAGDPVIEVVAGLDAGRRVAVPSGSSIVGRGAYEPGARVIPPGDASGDPASNRIEILDPSVSRRQFVIHRTGDRVRVRPLGSTNPTLLAGVPLTTTVEWPVGAVLTCGRARLRLLGHPAPVPPRDALDGAPPWTFHRLPESAAGEDPVALEVPAEPSSLPAVTPIGMASVFGSLLLAGVLVMVLGNWMYALFAGFGPVLAVLSSVDGRRRRRSRHRREGHRRHLELERFETRLLRHREGERRRIDERLPSAHRAVRVALGGPGGAEPAPPCWRRRSGAVDAHTVRLGHGPLPWEPPLESERSRAPSDVRAILDRIGSIPGAPIALPLTPGGPIVFVGPTEIARSVARSIVLQAATLHGPADLGIGLLAGADHGSRWSWMTWLPHTIGSGGFRTIGLDEATRARTAELLVPSPLSPASLGPPSPDESPQPVRRQLVLIDDPEGLRARRGPVRSLLRASEDPDAGLVPLVLVGDAPVPAGGLLLRLDRAGRVRFSDGRVVAADGIALGNARAAAIGLSRVADPDVDDTDRMLPTHVDLVDIVGPDRIDPRAIGARWRAAGPDPKLGGLIGTGANGAVPIDLVADGPHALIAGTTGSGKSEFLRSLIVSLALGQSPDHLTFVLIDFKGGSAFDACADLPHTIGVVTDLDEHLADRALVCLEAELRYREERLRAAGVSDLTELRRLPAAGETDPLPRMVVVIDEFATLAAELPEFVDALVGIAQRGRSLGVHLVLATQRPSGAVSDNIRANTALRIALRVHDRADSDDVIGSSEAALLPRSRPGRAILRFGPSETVTVQTAFVSGRALAPGRETLAVRRFDPSEVTGDRSAPGDDRSDLDALVDRLGEAWRKLGGRAPREVWPEPLPDVLHGPLPDRPEADDGLLIGLADVPERQRREPHRWSLDGPLLAIGLPGSGTTSVLTSAALAAASRWSPDDLHIQVIDCGRGSLAPLAALPHVGSVISEPDTERQRRLLERLGALFAERSASGTTGARHLLVVDGLGAFHDLWADRPEGPWAVLTELVRRGSAVGLHTVLAAEGSGRAPHQIVSACRQRVVLRLGDRADYAVHGIPTSMVPDLPEDRGIDPESLRLVQIARPARGLPEEVAALRARTREVTAGPRPVGVLPETVDLGDLEGPDRPLARSEGDGTLSLLIGISDRRLALARLVLPPASHALIAGPPRSGRTTALASLALAAASDGRPVLWIGASTDAPRGTVVGDPEDLDAFGASSSSVLIAVDDADLLADDENLAKFVVDRRAGHHLIAAARGDRLRSSWSSWLREVRADRIGILLDPDRDLDGDLLGTRLPREAPVPPRPGFGWLAGHPPGFAQIARPL